MHRKKHSAYRAQCYARFQVSTGGVSEGIRGVEGGTAVNVTDSPNYSILDPHSFQQIGLPIILVGGLAT